MIKYVIASSSSKGNACFIYSKTTLIQIDMGVTLSALNQAIEQTPFELKDIQGLLVTHEHSDHVKGLSLAGYKKLNIPTYAGNTTLENPTYVIEEENSFEIGDFTIIPVKTSHDANHPLGYILINGMEKMVYMTDTGYIPEESLPYMENAKYYIIESNHDVDMLEKSSRPRDLKNRILSSHGHLSNKDSAGYVSSLIGENTKEITLAHLSEECNTPDVTISTWDKVFKEKGLDIKDYNLRCAPASTYIIGGDKDED